MEAACTVDTVRWVTSMAFVAGVVEPFNWATLHSNGNEKVVNIHLGTLVFECDSWLALSGVKLDSDCFSDWSFVQFLDALSPSWRLFFSALLSGFVR